MDCLECCEQSTDGDLADSRAQPDLFRNRYYIGTIYGFAQRLLEHFRMRTCEDDGELIPAFQLRLDTS